MRLFFTLILATVFFCGRGVAQDGSITSAASALQDVLSNLKQSVEKLSLDNDQWAARDNAIKAQVLQLQMQLGQVQAQGDVLNKAADKLQDKNPRRAQQIGRLEKENFDLDNRIQRSEVGIKLVQQSMEAGYEEDQKLLLQLKGMTNVLPVAAPQAPSPESPAAAHLQIEKLKLMKMIYDSQQRQESLHEAILEYQKNTLLAPAAASALAQQELLKEQVKDLTSQIAAYPPESYSSNGPVQWDATQLRQWEAELKDLERNYSQLKDLVELMNKKAQDVHMTVSEHIEEEKLQGSIDDLKRQGVGLRVDLDDLRSQMVDLDKRKSRLEDMIQHLQ